ncbi:integral membrane protein, partial [mine drainage metagenome]
GEAWALVGSLATAVIGVGLFALFGHPLGQPGAFVLLVAGSGFVGCQIDSILGELLENRGFLTKGSTNFLGMLSSALMALGGLWWLGAH